MSLKFRNLYPALCLLFLSFGLPIGAQTTDYTWEIDSSETSVSKIVAGFDIFETDQTTSENNVHHARLTFQTNAVQESGGATPFTLKLYVPLKNTALNLTPFSTPYECDIIFAPTASCNPGNPGDQGCLIRLDTLQGDGNWQLDIIYKDDNPPIYGYINDNNGTTVKVDEFILIAENITLPGAAGPSGNKEITAEINSIIASSMPSAPTGTTGVILDNPPEVTITMPTSLLLPPDEPLSAAQTNPSTIGVDTAAVDFEGDYTDESSSPASPTNPVPDADPLSFKWTYGFSETAVADPAAKQSLTIDEGGDNYVYLIVTETLRTVPAGSIEQEGKANIRLVVKDPPAATLNVTSIGGAPPAPGPPVDDVPTEVSLRVTSVDHHDPIPEAEPFDDGNSTDYEVVRWEIQKEGYAVPTIISAGSLADPEVLPDQAISDSGKHRIKAIVKDDYDIEGEGYADIYVAPIEKMVFPPHRGVPFDNDEPDIDGVLDYFDVDGDGVRDPVDDPDTDDDIFEHGWTGSYRLTYENGVYPPNIAFQGTRNRYTGQPYMYLSFEVRNDPTFDDEDVIVLTFRRDADSTDPEDDRKIFIFPVYTDAGASEDDGSGGPADPDQNKEKYNKPPRLVQYWKKNAGGDWVTAGSITTAPDGFDTKVWSKTEGSSRNYDVEIQMPTNTAAGGADWINFDDDFLFYFNVIRVDSTDPGNLIAVENTWPRDLPIDYLAQNNLEDYPFPALVWGKSFKTTTDECRGVSLEAWNDIGIDDGSADLSHLMSLSGVNRFIARVTNNSEKVIEDPMAPGEHIVEPVDAEDVRATFRIAHWGVVGQNGDWREIPASDNPTGFYNIPVGAGGTAPKYELETNWTLSPAEADFYDDHLHQCIKVELDSIADTNILKKGVARNMDFDPTSSVFSRVARISTVGFGRPPAGKDRHSVILHVSTKKWERSKDPEGMAKKGSRGNDVDSYFNYIVNGYIDTGRMIVINGKSHKIYAPMGSFGYVVHHDGEVNDWRHDIEDADEVAQNTYLLEIEPENYVDVVTCIKSIVPRISISLHAGAATPVPPSNFANDYKTGFCGIIDMGYRISDKISVIGLFGYNYFPTKSTGTDPVSILNVALNAKYFIPIQPKLYLGIGAGPELFIRDFSTLDFGYDLDLSLDYKLNKLMTLEAGVIYHSHFNQEVWFIQSHGGIIFNF